MFLVLEMGFFLLLSFSLNLFLLRARILDLTRGLVSLGLAVSGLDGLGEAVGLLNGL